MNVNNIVDCNKLEKGVPQDQWIELCYYVGHGQKDDTLQGSQGVGQEAWQMGKKRKR